MFLAGATGPWTAAESGWGEQDASLAGDTQHRTAGASGLREGLLESGIPKPVAKSQELQKRVGGPGYVPEAGRVGGSQLEGGWQRPGGPRASRLRT